MSDTNDNKPTLRLVAPPHERPAEIPTDLVDEVALAIRLGVSRSTLQSWRYAGRGPRFLKIGRLIRYRNADIEAFLRASTRGKAA
jgi:predicted DNA-binding transcriptional regulator AlpA